MVEEMEMTLRRDLSDLPLTSRSDFGELSDIVSLVRFF